MSTGHHGSADKTIPIIVGATTGGFMSGLPLISCLNCFCCLPLFVAGFLASAMYARSAANAGLFPTVGTGGFLGAVAGLLGGLLGALISMVFSLLFSGSLGLDPAAVEEILRNIPPEQRQAAEEPLRQMSEMSPMVFVAGQVVMSCVFGLIVGAIGGMVGISVFRKQPPAPPTQTAPPMSPTPHAPPMPPVPGNPPPPPPPTGPGQPGSPL